LAVVRAPTINLTNEQRNEQRSTNNQQLKCAPRNFMPLKSSGLKAVQQPTTKHMDSPKEIPSELKWLDTATDLLDNRFRIPGTDIRFGADFLIGLIPYAGDVITFGISGLLVIVMARKGASGMVLGKMLGNIWIDGMVGTIPLLGDIFDLRYRANRRNLHLLREHYEEGQHRGSLWWIIIGILLVLLLMIGLSIFIIWKIAAYLPTLLGF
jgi:hypothetical protein